MGKLLSFQSRGIQRLGHWLTRQARHSQEQQSTGPETNPLPLTNSEIDSRQSPIRSVGTKCEPDRDADD